MKPDLIDLAAKVAVAIRAGHAAAEAEPHDGGSANLDHVVLTDLRGVREASLRKAGIPATKGRDGFHFALSFGGQGNRRYAGVQAMCRALRDAGVSCHVHYLID